MALAEEIVVRMGMDARPVMHALRGVRRDIYQFKQDLKNVNPMEVLSSAAGKVGITLSILSVIGAFTKALGRAMEFGAALTHLSERTGVSASTLQVFAMKMQDAGAKGDNAEKSIEKLAILLGQARSGSEDAAQAFAALGIAIQDNDGKAKTTEQVLVDVADKLAAIEDPTQRARAAFALFGEAGTKVAAALKDGAKGLEDFKKASGDKLLTDEEIARLGQLQKHWTGFFDFLRTKAGKAAYAASEAFMLEQWKEKPAWATGSAGTASDVESRATEGKQAAQLLDRIYDKRRRMDLESMSNKQRVLALQQELADVGDRIRNTDEMSVEQLTLRDKRLELQKELADAIKKTEEDALKLQKEKAAEQEKRQAQLEKERSTLEGINSAAEAHYQAQRNLENALADQSKFTLQDLASTSIDRGTTGEAARQIMLARQIQGAQEYSRALASHGYEAESQMVLAQIDKVRGGMTMLTEADRYPMLGMLQATQETAKVLGELLRKASEEGIRIEPLMNL